MTAAINIHPPLPTPQKDEKRLIQAEVDISLFNAVEREMPKGVKIRQVVEYGLKAYLLRTNPKEAERLGIHQEKILPSVKRS